MSSKINVCNIIFGHLNTLKDASSSRVSFVDIFTFFIIPLIFGCLFFLSSFKLNDSLISLLVNFGAIFTALLLSVLVLVYDQSSKLSERNERNEVPFYTVKKSLLDQLYYNICYSIVLALLLIFTCFLESITRGKSLDLAYFSGPKIDINMCFFTPIVVFISVHLILTIVMIVKRMHVLLTTE
ncbi:hypothetical protein DU977_04025 [Vibrio cholerae]|nr:hypothetical protein [Vibrio cholerae]